MKKVLSLFTIVLLCIVGVVYYCFFLDGRVFLLRFLCGAIRLKSVKEQHRKPCEPFEERSHWRGIRPVSSLLPR